MQSYGVRMCLSAPSHFPGSCAMMLFLFPSSITQPPPHTAVTLRLSHHGHMRLSLPVLHVQVFSPVLCCTRLLQPCLTLSDHIDCGLPGSSVCGILQARVLEWVAMTFSRESSAFPTLCDPIDGSPPGSPIRGILQAGTLEWDAIAFSALSC